jgi:hypothetical protein
VTSASEARQGLLDLTTLAERDLALVWSEISDLPAAQVREAMREILPAIADEYGSAAAALAADWYDDAREAAEVSGSFTAEPAELPTQERFDSLARWGTSPLFAETANATAALTLIAGGLQRSIADAHRLTVVQSSISDPQASGWKRVGVGSNCGFCQMLIGRGAVYTEASVTFRSHDHCNCAASPVWAKNVVKITGEPFRQSKKNRSDETKRRDNQRAYAFIAKNT